MKRILRIFMLISFISPGLTQAQIKDYFIHPVPFTSVKVQDQFWDQKIKTNMEVTIPIAFKKSQESGRIDNFKVAGKLMKGTFCSEFPFDDSDVYKIIEAASYSMQNQPDKKLESYIDTVITYIKAAQEPDGYLYTNRTILGENAHPWAGKKRWVNDHELSHELYNLGHLYEAAVAYYQATGKRSLLDISIKSANLLDQVFGPGKLLEYPGHQEVEIGLVKLYRVTGDKRYLNLAKFFLDIRGQKGVGEPTTYNQSHKPVIEQDEAVGHSVRAAYMWTGMADVAALTGDVAYVKAIERLWHDVVDKKLYLTGGIGAAGGHEGFGGPYELPNMAAYCETCAAVGNVFWNHRMFLMTGDSKYIDILELSLYNNVLSGVSLSGDHFFYPNPLESQGQHARSEWFGCACCPPNVCRVIASMPGYIYAQKDNSLFVNLYIASQTSFSVGNRQLTLKQEGNMPWDGNMKIHVTPSSSSLNAVLKLRIPGWAVNKPVPGDLYHYADQSNQKVVLKINGQPVEYKVENGYAVLDRKWKKNDLVEVSFPLEIRKVEANANVVADRDKVALMRGPLVYCAEWPDFDNEYILNLIVDGDATLKANYKPDFLKGVVEIDGIVKGCTKDSTEKVNTYPRDFKAIPYYAWANRGMGQMTVWMASDVKGARPKATGSITSDCKITASYFNKMIYAINDQLIPSSSNDNSNNYYHWWPRKNQTEWIAYEFSKPQKVSMSEVYWYDDSPWGGCRLPADWKIYYKDGNEWKPVETNEAYPIKKDEFNKVTFKPVTTTAVKLEVKLPESNSSGLHEWVVK
ncbi:MAG: glycoside hydrolase family 127 protein [Bacteroidota bacterium]|nr:glycoside hydrolase family 127 protein [Bacteroidota bacterium]MDP4204844.1 glycoside hydrolase family 127 protein [Bacteroidota bacterium]